MPTATGWYPLWALMLLKFALEFIAVCKINTRAIGQFVINLIQQSSPSSLREVGQQSACGQRREIRWQSEFGVGSKPAGRRLRPQFRGLRSEALASCVVGCLGLLAGVADEAINRVAEQAKAIQISLKQSAAQRKNILQAAFSGHRVPQDPSDEPASALLARIRAERQEQASLGKPKKSNANSRRSSAC